MTEVLQYIITMIPVVIALFAECGVVKWACSAINKIKETAEFKALIEQNKKLIDELNESKRLNKELLTKIDHIARGE